MINHYYKPKQVCFYQKKLPELAIDQKGSRYEIQMSIFKSLVIRNMVRRPCSNGESTYLVQNLGWVSWIPGTEQEIYILLIHFLKLNWRI